MIFSVMWTGHHLTGRSGRPVPWSTFFETTTVDRSGMVTFTVDRVDRGQKKKLKIDEEAKNENFKHK